MMKVVGEEGTSLDDYIVYQKGEFVDSVYLQQNSFDPVDAAVTVDRQKEVFDVLESILNANFQVEDKKDARNFFNELRQKFLDWNGAEEGTALYRERKEGVQAFFEARRK